MRLTHDYVLLLLIYEIHVPRVFKIVKVVVIVIVNVVVREVIT